MFRKFATILTLLASLLFLTQAAPVSARLAGMAQPESARCAGLQCAAGCCASMECCQVAKETNAPERPSPASPHVQAPATTVWLEPLALLFRPVPAPPSFAMTRETKTPHLPPPLAVGCIQLI